MNFPFYIARRYLFSKKSHNAINVISGISVCGVALATLALVCTLSVFNGFQDLVSNLFTAFDPELKIMPATGKVFDGQDKAIAAIRKMPEVDLVSESLEDNALVQYQGRQAMAVIKGVEDNFEELTPIDTILFGRGELLLHDEVVDYAIPGVQLLATLGTGIRFLDPLEVYAPKRGAKVNMANPAASFTGGNLFSSGLVFAVNQEEYDVSVWSAAASSVAVPPQAGLSAVTRAATASNTGSGGSTHGSVSSRSSSHTRRSLSLVRYIRWSCWSRPATSRMALPSVRFSF